ncbi:sterol O-acyltransferase 1 [Eublepharis macularius]|uniref:O-acyltransferase n=1 Tax=Eublepharis macularius TaxID=481883 RepID=A0AA97JDK9_EUBMA|nr:sterol O-acyltransferase 1 [Eublepharis macularius]
MVGEDNISVRNRRSAYSTTEKDDVSRRHEEDWSFSKFSNGRVDVDHVITKKMQLLAEAERLKPSFMKGIDSHFSEFVDGLVSKSTLLESSISAFPTTCSEKDVYKAKDSRAPPEHGKVFVVRKSLLDELFEVEHIRTIYHMFIAFLILFILSTLVIDFIDEGRFVLEFDLLVYAFGKFSIVTLTWLCMALSTVAVPFGLFCQWAQGYHGSSHKTVRSLFFGTLFMLFQIVGLGLGPTCVALYYDLPPASRFIVILEQVRLIMKAHSFIRENIPRVRSSRPQKTNSVQIPRFSQYLYFLFAPTLIYRDEYPRTPTRRWSYVATKFAQVLGSLFYTYYIFMRICIPTYRNYSQEPFSPRGLVLCIFHSILPGVLIFFLIFFSFLHCWLNAFAEMLRFGDRMFYKDWWNSTSYANYYRTWNIVVHDWLYYYAYRDFLGFFGKKFKSTAMLSVFAVSAAVHEYVLTVCFGFFYPVMFCLFMFFGMLFNFIINDQRKGSIWNVIMWTSLFLGQGMMLCFYSQEWYAHRYCPLKNPTFLDYLKPRSWTCLKKI